MWLRWMKHLWVGNIKSGIKKYLNLKEDQQRIKPCVWYISGCGKIKIEVAPNMQAQTLKSIIEKYVKEVTIMLSDEWDSYNSI